MVEAPPHVVMFPFPAQGHINPALQLAQHLASSLSLCRVTFINTSHNIAKLREAQLDLLGPHIRLQALADDGQHGLGPDFFQRVDQMGGLLETLLLKLLHTPAQTEDDRGDAGHGGFADECGKDHHIDLQRPCAQSLGHGDPVKSCGDLSMRGECSGHGGECDADASWPPPICIISDVFLGWVQDIADKLDLPRFILYTPSPATLVLMLSLPDMLRQGRLPCAGVCEEALMQPLNLPGLTPTLRLADIPSHLLLLPSAFMFDFFVRHSKRIPEAAAVLLNTCGELQLSAVDAAAQALLDTHSSMWDNLLQKHQLPRVIPVGPLLPSCVFDESRSSRVSVSRVRGAEDDMCIKWLQRQAPSSVVYVSFGSMAELPDKQIQELAWGLEACGKPFLWVARGLNKCFLPPGFNAQIGSMGTTIGAAQEALASLDRDRICMQGTDTGLVDYSPLTMEPQSLVVSWAPQLDVLSHPSVAVFLSHCGWNSALEAICTGVPVLGWPLFAEQRMNCRFLVDELKVAMEFKKGEGGIVGRKEVERVIREALETEQGCLMRGRASKWKNLARNARREGGSSQENMKAFGSLLSSLQAKR